MKKSNFEAKVKCASNIKMLLRWNDVLYLAKIVYQSQLKM